MPEPIDEFYGVGGSYLLNPKTGKRTLVERTQEPTDTVVQPTTEISNASVEPSPDASGEN
jgi:hypothetical protein